MITLTLALNTHPKIYFCLNRTQLSSLKCVSEAHTHTDTVYLVHDTFHIDEPVRAVSLQLF